MKLRHVVVLPLLTFLAACSSMGPVEHPDARARPPQSFYQDVVAASDRDKADRELDAGRHPAEMLRFFGIAPGMRVAEISAGGGYTAELLARTVGPDGKVYAQNSPFILKRFAAQPWGARMKKPVMKKNVVRL